MPTYDHRRARGLLLRENADEGSLVVSGYCATFNQPYELWPGMREQVAPGAFAKSLRDYPDNVVLWNHDAAIPLARVGGGVKDEDDERDDEDADKRTDDGDEDDREGDDPEEKNGDAEDERTDDEDADDREGDDPEEKDGKRSAKRRRVPRPIIARFAKRGGRRSLEPGEAEFAEDDRGLFVRWRMLEEDRPYFARIRSGVVRQMSFGFNIEREEWDRSSDDFVLDTLTQVRLFEGSPVTFPANPQTELGVERQRGEWMKRASGLHVPNAPDKQIKKRRRLLVVQQEL